MSRAKPHPRSNKGKSAKRWATGDTLSDLVLPTLPKPSHCAILLVCWLHAKIGDDGKTIFDLTKEQIATRCGLKESTVKGLLRELETGGVIRTRKDGCNQGGRSLGSERMITFEPYQEPTKGGRQ
ncbi:hypothetical protein FF011L_05690 [Roseimaritima multifibrata]|uniref:HTH crp-type domain-containing protein n=1 Tax=Roseimaritima multifibrata TaxID=1930274 RepID=A0A517MAD2_9BACT|nr:hypothetical protein FF011L_05690 [Roseimaritima multifibrata]